jgi:hypothetical protein
MSNQLLMACMTAALLITGGNYAFEQHPIAADNRCNLAA